MLKRPLCVLVACCLAAPVWASDKDLVRQLTELQSQVLAQSTRLNVLEAASVPREQILGLLKEVDALKEDIAQLRGDRDEQAHQLDLLEKRQKDLYLDLDQRMTEQGKALSKLSEPPAPPPAPAVDAGQETSSYEAALDQFKARDFTGAIDGFKGFLKTYPSSTLAANAQYWIGYSHFALKDYKNALAQQQKLLALYPDSPKAADAMLNIASSQIELKQNAAAKKTLSELVAKYPDSTAAKIAAKRVTTLK
jgi:tol-pal system protein YbgF